MFHRRKKVLHDVNLFGELYFYKMYKLDIKIFLLENKTKSLYSFF